MGFRHDWGSWIALLLPLTGILPSVGNGVIDAADSIFHVHRIYALRLLLDQGELYPRWVSYFHLGYGYPIFNFYAPGSYYVGALFTYFGFDAPTAFNVLSTLAWMLGSLGCYRLARRFLPIYPALLAALLWAYAPSRLYEVWEQGSLPQTLAAACLPWLLMGMNDALGSSFRRALVGVAFPFAAILFTHQPTSVIAALTAAVFGLLLVCNQLLKGWNAALKLVVRLACGLFLGIGMAAIFVLPALIELPFVDAARGTDDIVEVLQNSFLRPEQLFVPQGSFDLTDLRRDLPKTFGLIPGMLAITGLIALCVRRRFRLALTLAVATALVALMLLSISFVVWEVVPLLAQLRFPERFLRIGAVPLALLGGAALLWVAKRWQGAVLLALGLLVIISAMPSLLPTEHFLTWESLSAIDEIRMEMDEYIWGSTSYNEFNPVWGERIALDPPADITRYRDSPLQIDVQRFDCPGSSYELLDDRTYRFRVEENCTVDFRQYYYPGWLVTLDGAAIEVEPEPDLGLIRAVLPPGEHVAMLRYVGTTVQMGSALLTALSLVAALMMMVHLRKAQPVPLRSPEVREAMPWRVGAAGSGLCVLIALFVYAWVLPYSTWFRVESPPDAPAAMTTRIDADFGGRFQLLGYRLDGAYSSPTDQIDIELFWRAVQPIRENFRPIVQLIDPAVTTAYAVSQPFRPAAGHTLGWTPDRFASDPHRLVVFDFVDMAPARISIEMVHSESGMPLLLPDGTDRLVLDVALILDG